MLPAWCVIFAIFFRLFGGLHYARAVIKRRARPNPITWFFWALTPMITFVAQLYEHVGWSAATTFALGFTPLIIFFLSLKHNLNRSHFTFSTIACGAIAALGVIFWLNAKDPLIAIFFSIVADAFASMPTVIKAYRDPGSEFFPSYYFSILSMIISMLTVTQINFASLAFPAYILFINLVIICAGILGRQHKKPST